LSEHGEVEKATDGDTAVLATMGPRGPVEIAALPSHINESTAARNAGTRPANLFGQP